MSKKIRVMIVDDSAFARDIISTILSSDPEIEIAATAFDGQDALDKLINVKPDLVTMDIVMPRMGGLEAIEHIMAFFPTPILVVTSQQDAHIAFQALNKGALEVVEKPSYFSSCFSSGFSSVFSFLDSADFSMSSIGLLLCLVTFMLIWTTS